jgi:hypothetical protein
MRRRSFTLKKNLVLVLAFSLILVSCATPKAPETATPQTVTSLSTQNSSSTPVAETLTVVPTFSADSASKFVIDAFTRLSTAYPYRLVETSRGATDVDRTTDFAAADQVHSTWVLAPNPDQQEMIQIGNQVWFKTNGQWQAGDVNALGPVDVTAMIVPGLHDVQFVGQEAIVGVPCYKFSYTLALNTAGVDLTGTGNAWIGIADGLPHQLDLNATTSGMPLTSHIVYSYGIKFDIQKPVP